VLPEHSRTAAVSKTAALTFIAGRLDVDAPLSIKAIYDYGD
jgi:hypothetical protein